LIISSKLVSNDGDKCCWYRVQIQIQDTKTGVRPGFGYIPKVFGPSLVFGIRQALNLTSPMQKKILLNLYNCSHTVGSNTPYKKQWIRVRIGFEAMILPINGLIQVCLFVSFIYDLWLVKGQKKCRSKGNSLGSIHRVKCTVRHIRNSGFWKG
jgi:hypothetical protein